MTRIRWFAVIGLMGIAVLLAFPLRGIAHQLIVLPLAYAMYRLNLIYLSLPQEFWWLGVILVTIFLLARSLFPDLGSFRESAPPAAQTHGQVESLATSIRKTDKGIYFKWLVANRLGRLAYQILLQREHRRPRSIISPLEGEGWGPAAELKEYLEKGLHGSFADFPNSNWSRFIAPEKTVLDHDVADAVEFLEKQVSGDSYHQRRN